MLSDPSAIDDRRPASEHAPVWTQLRLAAEMETGMDLSGSRFPRLRDAAQKVLAHSQPAGNLERILNRPEERGPFLELLTAELTIGETFFLRNEHHFRVLREHVLPAILQENAPRREIRIWSAGCATGEEAYSIAILVDELLAGKGPWQVMILGTDLNREFLERAAQACYRQWSFRLTKVHQDRQYFTPEGDAFRLAQRIRDRVRFVYLNLVKDIYPSPLTGTLGLDLILFRNVAIYLKPEVTRAILERFHRALRPGGWLLLGETEVTLAQPEGFEARRFDQATFFRKADDRAARAESLSLPPPPVLATVKPILAGAPLAAPLLPVWVPLPTASGRHKQAGGGTRQETGQRGSGDVPWERIERLVAARSLDEAERALERIANKKERSRLRLRYAQALLACAEIARAHRMIEVCLKEEPLLVEAQLLKASFAEEAGDLKAAEQAYRRALYMDRDCPMAHFHLALVQRQKGDRAGSVRSLQTTLKLAERKDPHALVDYGEGVCYGRLKEMAASLL